MNKDWGSIVDEEDEHLVKKQSSKENQKPLKYVLS